MTETDHINEVEDVLEKPMIPRNYESQTLEETVKDISSRLVNARPPIKIQFIKKRLIK